MAKQLLGTAITDENGVATFTYTGTGAGKINIVAESGNLISDIYEIFDCLFYDEATTENHKEVGQTASSGSWYNYQNKMGIEYSIDGMKITHIENSTTAQHLYYNDPNISTEKLNGINTILNNCIIEFDVTNFTGSPAIYMFDNIINRAFGFTSTGHYKIVLDGVFAYIYKDENQTPSSSFIFTGTNIRFSFMLNEYNESITIKNFMIYNNEENLLTPLFYDEMTSAYHKEVSQTASSGSWYNYQNKFDVQYTQYGMKITHTEDSTTAQHLYYNDPSISTEKNSGVNTILNNCIIEFDVANFTSSPAIYLNDGSVNKNILINTIGHYKVILDGSYITIYLDNNETPIYNQELTGTNIRFSFMLNEYNENVVLKGFIIYTTN